MKQTLYRGFAPAPEIELQVEPPFVVRRINPCAYWLFPTMMARLLFAAETPLSVATANPLDWGIQDDPPLVVLSMTFVPYKLLLPTVQPVFASVKNKLVR